MQSVLTNILKQPASLALLLSLVVFSLPAQLAAAEVVSSGVTVRREVPKSGAPLTFTLQNVDPSSIALIRVDIAVRTPSFRVDVKTTPTGSPATVLNSANDIGDAVYTIVMDPSAGVQSFDTVVSYNFCVCFTSITTDITVTAVPFVPLQLQRESDSVDIPEGNELIYRVPLNYTAPHVLVPGASLQTTVDLFNFLNEVSVWVGVNLLPDATTHNGSATTGSGDQQVSVALPSGELSGYFYIRVLSRNCAVCISDEITLSVKAELVLPHIPLSSGVEYSPPDIAEGAMVSYYIDVPPTAGANQVQLDVEADVFNPFNTIYLYLNKESVANATHYMFKQDDGEKGDLSVTFNVEPGRWYITVFGRECFGCWEITYDIKPIIRPIMALSDNAFASSVSYEGYSRLFYFDMPAVYHGTPSQVDFRVEMDSQFLAFGRLEICVKSVPLGGNIEGPFGTQAAFNSDNCDLTFSEFGDLSDSLGMAGTAAQPSNRRLYIAVRTKYCNVVCTDITFDMRATARPIPMLSLFSNISGSVYEKTWNFYAVRVDEPSAVIGRAYFDRIYSLFGDLYIMKDRPPTTTSYVSAATNFGALAILHPSIPDRVVSAVADNTTSVSQPGLFFLGLKGTSCGGLCNSQPYTIAAVSATAYTDEIPSISAPSSSRPTMLIILLLVGLLLVVTSCTWLICARCFCRSGSQQTVTPEPVELEHVNNSSSMNSQVTAVDIRLGAPSDHKSSSSSTWRTPAICLIVMAVGITLTVVALVSLETPEEPVVAFCGYSVKNWNIFELAAGLNVKMIVSNPNWLSAKLKELTTRISLQGRQIGLSALANTPVQIAAGNYTQLDFDVSFDLSFDDVVHIIDRLFGDFDSATLHDNPTITVGTDTTASVSTDSILGIEVGSTVAVSKQLTFAPFAPNHEPPSPACQLVR